jgi:UDP:flavonoid glycosyltransferase YjiC (YdhE family)
MIDRVKAAGFEARELAEAHTLQDRLGFPGPGGRVFGYLASPAVGEELVSVVRDEKPDAVVIDAMFSAALDVAPRFGVPSGVIVHTFARRTFEMWRGNLAMQSQGREKAGFSKLAPVEHLWGDRDLVHANTLDALDAGGPVPLSNLRHGAPVLSEEPRAGMPSLPWSADDRTPLVLVAFSTVTEQRSAPKLQRALDALAPLPVHVVATTGDIVDPGELRAPSNACVLRYASHDALMPRASVVLTHGGHGTAMRSLRNGLPMVITPAGAGDQPFVASAVQEWGAGRALPPDASADDMRAAVEAVLGSETYRAKARELGSLLEGTDGAAAAATSLERLVGLAAGPR